MAVKSATAWHAYGGKWKRRDTFDAAPFIAGVTKPTTSNVGLSNPAILTDLVGTQTITTPGTVLQNRRIKGHVINQSGGQVTLINCLVTGEGTIPAVHSQGTNPTGFVALGLVTNSSGSILIQDCEIEPIYHQYWLNGIKVAAGTVTVQRSIVRGLDSINVGAATLNVSDSVLGPNHFCSVCEDQRSSSPSLWSHNDCIQITSAAASVTVANVAFFSGATSAKGDLGTFEGTAYSGLTWGCGVTYSGGAVSAPVLDVNRAYFTGPSQAHIQANAANLGTLGSVRNSMFDWSTHEFSGGSTYAIRTGSGTILTDVTSNVWSSLAGPLTRTLAGVTHTIPDGTAFVVATAAMTSTQLSKAGARLGGL